ncbi:MAG: STAS domain-containing protein [Desulfuromonadales bacterium]|nr:STAS domain-containing protein [Desulfuromonadales bacterium]
MDIKLEMDNDVIILKLIGSLVASSAAGLKKQTVKLIEKKYRFILLDLGKIDFIDSSGLGACIAINRDLVASLGTLACAGLNENVQKVFRMTRADQKILIFDDRHAAVNALTEMIATADKSS